MTKAEDNRAIGEKLLAALGAGDPPRSIAAMFAEDVAFDVPGDTGVLPWIGKNVGRGAVVTFVSALRELTVPLKFDVKEVLASDRRVVILVDIASKLKATGATMATEGAIVLEIEGGSIRRFLLLEDSFEVSRKARQ